MSVGRICSRVVVTASPTESVRTAAWRMAEQDVGTLIVLDGVVPGHAIGLLTDRDIAIRCVAADLDPDTTPLSEVMTSPVHAVDESTPMEEAIERMAALAVRRLVVTGEKQQAIGVLSLDDILDVFVREVDAIGQLLEKQQPVIRR
jgi:CBS domain-containing protein